MKLKAIILVATLLLAMAACSSREQSSQQMPELSSAPSSQHSSAPTPSSSSSAQSGMSESASESGASASDSTPPSSSESSAESKSEPSPPPAATPFRFSASEVLAVYARNYSDYTYSPLEQQAAAQLIPMLLEAGAAAAEDLHTNTEGGFLVVLNDADRTRFSYTLIPTAVRVGTEAHTIPQERYNALLSIANNAIQQSPSYIQWLAFMDPNRLSSVTFYPDGPGNASQIASGNIGRAAALLSTIQVKKGTGNAVDVGSISHEPAAGHVVIQMNFTGDNGTISYSIAIENGVFNIESSDMTFACQYQLLTSTSDLLASLEALSAAG